MEKTKTSFGKINKRGKQSVSLPSWMTSEEEED
jgi:hypothetical protein